MASQDRAVFQVRAFPQGKGAQILDLTGRVTTFEYLDHTSKADRLSLTVDNHDLGNFDDPIWRKDTALQVAWGYNGNMSETRRCIITEVRGGLRLSIVALEQSAIMHMIKKCRVWKGLTLRQLADRLEAEYAPLLGGAKGKYSKPEDQTLTDADKIVITHAQQAAESDAHFLARLARKYGATFSTSATGHIQFHEINLKTPPVKTITWRGGDGNWMEFDVENNIAVLIGAATVKGIDTLTKTKVEHTANNDTTKRDGLMPVVEVLSLIVADDGVTHYDMVPVSSGSKPTPSMGLGDMFNGLVAALTGSSSVENTEAHEAGTEQVKVKADSKYKASQRGTIKLTGTLIGDPKVRAKQILLVQGLGKRLSGRYHIVQARHHISQQGKYTVVFVAKTDGHGGYGNGNNVPSKAAQNTENPLDSKGAVKTKTVLIKDEQTGVEHYEFRPVNEDT